MTHVEITAQVSKRCPYKDERDDGTVTLVFDVGDEDAPELHELADLLGTWRDTPISHEEFTRSIGVALGCVEVRSTWQTAGLDVTVEVR